MLGERSAISELMPLDNHDRNGGEVSGIECTQFADDDDTTVQLLADAEELPDGVANGSSRLSGTIEPLKNRAGADAEYLSTPDLEIVPRAARMRPDVRESAPWRASLSGS